MVNPWFRSKNGHFSFFVLGNIDQGNVFYDILERQKRHPRLQKQEVRKVEKLTFFPKGFNPCFWSKNGHFSNFFLGNIGQENLFYDILERKNAFLGYRNTNFKKLKNWHFSKGVNLWFWSKNGHISIILVQKWKFFQLFFRQYNPGKCFLRYSRKKKLLSRL